ncbi:MAG: RluA family pseudouridine synthase [Clostridia bacterium]|nr:RluA family pseudouridine synthase [Clostridia bacterium]
MILEHKILETDTYTNVKEVLKAHFNISDRLLLRLKNAKKILLNGTSTYVSKNVSAGDTVTAVIDFTEENLNIVPTKMNLDIIYEDDSYLIINKAPNTPVHPSMLHYENSLSNGVRYYFDSINLKRKIRPVNRLDKDTSGLVIFAKNEYIQERLVAQMKSKVLKKTYIAVCDGIFSEKNGTINLPIARKPGSIIERCIDSTGDLAITHYEVIQEHENFSIVKCLLETGRTHQIRVHLASQGHPILGDTLYGDKNTKVHRQLLHAYKLSFVHPITNKVVEYTAPIPRRYKKILSVNVLYII